MHCGRRAQTHILGPQSFQRPIKPLPAFRPGPQPLGTHHEVGVQEERKTETCLKPPLPSAETLYPHQEKPTEHQLTSVLQAQLRPPAPSSPAGLSIGSSPVPDTFHHGARGAHAWQIHCCAREPATVPCTEDSTNAQGRQHTK